MNFKLIYCGFFDSKIAFGNMKESKERKVEFYEIELFTEDGGISFVGNDHQKISKGTLLFAKPGELRHSVFPTKAFYVRFDVYSPEFIEILNGARSFYNAQDSASKILKCMHDIFDVSQTSGTNHPVLECKMHKLIDEFLRFLNESNANQKFCESCSETIRRAIEFIDNKYNEKISIESIARHIHLSPIYFHGLFKRETGITPYAYITRKRIQQAQKSLETSDKKIAIISAACGFSSQSYFTDVFKKSIGCTPKEYRKAYYEKYLN